MFVKEVSDRPPLQSGEPVELICISDVTRNSSTSFSHIDRLLLNLRLVELYSVH